MVELRKISSEDPRVKVIENSRNFGPFNSMFNGLLATKGDIVIPFLPADCQDPPEVIPQLVEAWRSGFEIVYGVRAVRHESFLLRFFRSRYYKLVNKWSSISLPVNVGEFGLVEKKVVESLRGVDDYYPYVRGLIANTGFRSTSVPYTWVARTKGVSKNNAYALIDQALNGIISFTNIPTRLLLFTGAAVSSLAFLYAVFSLISGALWYGKIAEPGILTLIVAVFFFSGVIIFALGVLGEYISAIHSQVRRRPLVTERERINF
jgi:glycosyltransferase involved in cell wall biosynthesis